MFVAIAMTATATDTTLLRVMQNEIAMCDSIQQYQDSIIASQSVQINDFKKEMESNLWGNIDPYTYLWGMVFAFIGIFINTTVITRKAIKTDKNSPDKFSVGYWIRNNQDRLLRWIGTLAMIFIAMRFSGEIFGQTLTMFFAFLLGFCLDYVYEVFKKLKLQKE